jgi:peptidyl-prolyl isomerase D
VSNWEADIINWTAFPESIRYLDVHPFLPEESPVELKESYDALLAPLLLNSALAAIRVQPPSASRAEIAIKSATRALDTLTLSDSDKGADSFCLLVG